MNTQTANQAICPRCHGPMKPTTQICSLCRGQKVRAAAPAKPLRSLLKLRQSSDPFDCRVVAAVDMLADGYTVDYVRQVHGKLITDEALKLRHEVEEQAERRGRVVSRPTPGTLRPPEYDPERFAGKRAELQNLAQKLGLIGGAA